MDIGPPRDPLSLFHERKEKVIGFATQLRGLGQERADTETVQVLDDFMDRFRGNRFLVVVVGDFKSGKSSFVNALVQRTICPVRAKPRTAKITRLTGIADEQSKEFVEIHFLKDLPPQREELTDGALEHLVTVDGASAADVQYVDVHLKPRGTVLRNQIRLVDTPGLGSGEEEHSRITRNYLDKADLLLFVFSASKPFSESERDFLLSFRHLSNRTIFIVNQIDRVPEDERGEVLEHIKSSLVKDVLGNGIKVPPLYPLSSREAFGGEGKTLQGASVSSGLTNIVNELERKLADDIGVLLVRNIAEQQLQVCERLSNEVQISLELHRIVPPSRVNFRERKEKLFLALQAQARNKDALIQEIEGKERQLVENGPRFVQDRFALLRNELSQWILKCPNEKTCKQHLPSIVAKLLADRLDELDEQLQSSYQHIAQNTSMRLGQLFARMEKCTRDELVEEPKHVAMLASGGSAWGVEALSRLSSLSNGVGGAEGGHGLATAALSRALATSPLVQVLSVAAGVSTILAALGGPFGWVVAGVSGIFAAIFGLIQSSSWRERVIREVSQTLESQVLPKALDTLLASVRAFCRGMEAEVENRVRDVQSRLTGIIEEISREFERDEAARQQQIRKLTGYCEEVNCLQGEIAEFVKTLPCKIESSLPPGDSKAES